MAFAFALPACGEGTQVWSADCGQFNKLTLDLAVRHTFEGTFVGWGLFARRPLRPAIALYNNAFTLPWTSPYLTGGTYVGWGYDGHSFSSPAPTDVYTPMPLGPKDKVAVFDPAAAVGATPTGRAMFINIFVDPGQMSKREFSTIKNCFAAHLKDLNTALAVLPNEVPPHAFIRPSVLSLGGIAYERPPLNDLSFMAAANAKSIPSGTGDFYLYPGASVVDVIGGHTVRVIALPGAPVVTSSAPNVGLEVDGKPVRWASNGATDVPGVSLSGGGGWSFEPPFCEVGTEKCGVSIMLRANPNSVGSETLGLVRDADRSY
jgi:hypothetical protein